MSEQNLSATFRKKTLVALAFAFAGCLVGVPRAMSDETPAAPAYHVTKTMNLGGEGAWDYVTLDPRTGHELLYLPRTTHAIVVDTGTGKTVADFGKTQRAHGIAIAPDAGRGFLTDGKAGTVVVFDLKTYEVLGTIAAADDADGIIYDPASQRMLVSCGDANALVPIDPLLDPKAGKADPAIDLGGKPEFLAADGKGRAYVALVDKNVVAAVDTKSMKVVARWATGAGTSPTGLAIDGRAGHLFVGCRNQKLIVMSTADGTVLAELPIGRGVDATAFRAPEAFASCGDGTLAVVRETSPSKFEVVETVKTAVGSRTMAVDQKTGTIYLPGADMDPPTEPNGRPKPKAGTFKVLVVGRGH